MEARREPVQLETDLRSAAVALGDRLPTELGLAPVSYLASKLANAFTGDDDVSPRLPKEEDRSNLPALPSAPAAPVLSPEHPPANDYDDFVDDVGSVMGGFSGRKRTEISVPLSSLFPHSSQRLDPSLALSCHMVRRRLHHHHHHRQRRLRLTMVGYECRQWLDYGFGSRRRHHDGVGRHRQSSSSSIGFPVDSGAGFDDDVDSAGAQPPTSESSSSGIVSKSSLGFIIILS